jgi:hypothetical protein
MPTRPEITGRRRPTTSVEVDRQPGPPTEDPAAQEPTEAADSDVDSESSPPRIRGPPTMCFTIGGFCRAHAISESFYFKLRAQGLGPAELRLGSRVLITREAAEAWRIEHTQAATVGLPAA